MVKTVASLHLHYRGKEGHRKVKVQTCSAVICARYIDLHASSAQAQSSASTTKRCTLAHRSGVSWLAGDGLSVLQVLEAGYAPTAAGPAAKCRNVDRQIPVVKEEITSL